MTARNPYAPPRVAVEELARPAGDIPPCLDVERACKLFWLGFGAETINEVVEQIRLEGGAGWWSSLAGSLIALAVSCLFTWWVTRKLRAGRNWMRWFITILNIVSIPAVVVFWDFFEPIYRDIAQNISAAIFLGLQTLAGVAALVLLFTRASREWFASQARA